MSMRPVFFKEVVEAAFVGAFFAVFCASKSASMYDPSVFHNDDGSITVYGAGDFSQDERDAMMRAHNARFVEQLPMTVFVGAAWGVFNCLAAREVMDVRSNVSQGCKDILYVCMLLSAIALAAFVTNPALNRADEF